MRWRTIIMVTVMVQVAMFLSLFLGFAVLDRVLGTCPPVDCTPREVVSDFSRPQEVTAPRR